MKLEPEIRAELKKLLGAIAHDNHREAMKAHKILYHIGPPTISLATNALLGLNLSSTTSSRVKATVEMRHVTALVSLIHDIDENASKQIAQQLIQKGCGSVTQQRLKSILEFTLDDYVQYQIRGVNIFEHKQIKSQFNIRSRLERWLRNVSDDDPREIERIYIVSRSEDQDYASWYPPIFYNIKLVWDAAGAKFNPVTWLKLMWVEKVLGYFPLTVDGSRRICQSRPRFPTLSGKYSKVLLSRKNRKPLDLSNNAVIGWVEW